MSKIVLPFIRTPYNYDRNAASDESGLKCEDVSRCRQSFAEEADINTIVRRFHLTGEMPSDVRAPTYGDFTEVVDFHSAMNAVAAAGESFDRLPAEVRARFHNDPGEFVEFCSNDENRVEAEKLGLVFKKEAVKLPVDRNGAVLDRRSYGRKDGVAGESSREESVGDRVEDRDRGGGAPAGAGAPGRSGEGVAAAGRGSEGSPRPGGGRGVA